MKPPEDYGKVVRRVMQVVYNTSGPQATASLLDWNAWDLANALCLSWADVQNQGMYLRVNHLHTTQWVALSYQEQYNSAMRAANIIWNENPVGRWDDGSIKCECGSHACGSKFHSTWCPLYTIEGEMSYENG